MPRERLSKIENDATTEQHLRQLEVKGQAYLAQATKQQLPGPTRQKILAAALKYLEARAHHNTSPQRFSQAPSQTLTAAAHPTSGFQTLLTSLLDETVAAHSLIEACARAADLQFTSILVKCLYILSAIGPITDHKALTTIRSQTQVDDQEEDDLFGENEENQNPQHSPQLRSNQVAVRRTGQSFVDEFVSQLVSQVGAVPKASQFRSPDGSKSTQTRSSAVFAASVAREAPLSDNAAQSVLRLLTQRMTQIQLLEIPAFLYQLLLFASSRGTPAAKARVLLHIADVFSGREAKAFRAEALSQSLLAEDEDAILPDAKMSELRQVQGTALLHIEYAVKHDPTLSAELIKLAKAGVETPRHMLNSFGTGILLSLTRTASVQTDVLVLLREVMVRFHREKKMRETNMYMARVSINDDPLLDLDRSLLHIAECTCEVGWDYVKESLLQLSLVLLDKPLPLACGENLAENIANSLIFKLFNAHSSMRESILEQLTTRIALQEKSAHQAIGVISKLSDRIPFYVLEHSRFIRDGIELLTTLPPWMAADLMNAYKPLLLARPDMQDYFQLVIRKSLFHRDTSSRAVAIHGFLMTTAMSSSTKQSRQVSAENVYTTGAQEQCDHEVGTLMESIQPLRRVFSYPAPLRAYWYMNIVSMLQDPNTKRAAPTIASAVSEILRSHLLRFIDAAHAPYVLVEHCVDEQKGGKLVEPLGDLVWALAVAELAANCTGYSKSFIVDLAKMLASVSYQDFPFLKEPMIAQQESGNNNDDFEEISRRDEVVVVRANRNKARTLGSVAEALINTILIIPKEDQEWRHYAEIVIPLLQLKENLFTLLRNAGAGTVFDAFDDLGGDLNIEKLRPAMKMLLHRAGKSGTGSKKGGTSRKPKGMDPASCQAGSTQTVKHRFGVFSVLSSTSSRPTLPLEAALQTLTLMSQAEEASSEPQSILFQGKCETRDFQELAAYLYAIVQKHVEEFVSLSSKASREETVHNNVREEQLVCSTKTLARIAMVDFRRVRTKSPDETTSRGLRALQTIESCAAAVRFLAQSRTPVIVAFCKTLMPDSNIDHLNTEELFDAAIDTIEHISDELMNENLFREGMVVLQIHNSMIETIFRALSSIQTKSAFLGKRIQWAVDTIGERQIDDAAIVKSLVQTCLLYTENNNDLRRAGQISQRLLIVFGNCDENADPPEEQPEFKLCSAMAISQGTCLATLDAVLDVVDRALLDVEWCIGRMTSLETAANSGIITESEHLNAGKRGNEEYADAHDETAKQAIRAEDAAQIRLEGIVRTLSGLAKCAIGKWAQQERLLRLITKGYKLLSASTQAQVKRRGDPRTSFVSLINECKDLAPTLWTYLAFVGTDVIEDHKRKGPSKATREARVMPRLVYEVEKFEKVLISAQKRTKISLLRGMRRNIARDFRIREDRLQDEAESHERVQQEVPSAVTNENDTNEDSSRHGKRRRMS